MVFYSQPQNPRDVFMAKHDFCFLKIYVIPRYFYAMTNNCLKYTALSKHADVRLGSMASVSL